VGLTKITETYSQDDRHNEGRSDGYSDTVSYAYLYDYTPLWLNPVEGIITSPGGLRYNPVTGRREFHDGIDIAAPIGTKIIAPRDGRVISVGKSPSFGRFLRIAHPDGYISFMAHLHGVIVYIGSEVYQGQHIAYSGNTGRSTGPHLHFGLFRNGQYVDPINYVNLPKSANFRAALTG